MKSLAPWELRTLLVCPSILGRKIIQKQPQRTELNNHHVRYVELANVAGESLVSFIICQLSQRRLDREWIIMFMLQKGFDDYRVDDYYLRRNY